MGARADSDTPTGDGHAPTYRPGYEQVAGQILRYIAAEGLKPGDRILTEAEFATTLGVSRSQVREAVKMLTALGRVTTRKGAGVLVAQPIETMTHEAFGAFVPVDLEDIFGLFELRRCIESAAARFAASRATPVELRRITEAVEECEAAAAEDNFSRFRAADVEFHSSIATASHNSFFGPLVKIITQLRRQVIDVGLKGSRSGSLEQAAAQHRAVVAAIASGDADAADAAMCAHLDVTLRQFQDRVRERIFAPDGGVR